MQHTDVAENKHLRTLQTVFAEVSVYFCACVYLWRCLTLCVCWGDCGGLYMSDFAEPPHRLLSVQLFLFKLSRPFPGHEGATLHLHLRWQGLFSFCWSLIPTRHHHIMLIESVGLVMHFPKQAGLTCDEAGGPPPPYSPRWAGMSMSSRQEWVSNGDAYNRVHSVCVNDISPHWFGKLVCIIRAQLQKIFRGDTLWKASQICMFVCVCAFGVQNGSV